MCTLAVPSNNKPSLPVWEQVRTNDDDDDVENKEHVCKC